MDDARLDGMLRAMAAQGLPGVADPRPVGVRDAEWGPLLGRVRQQRITGPAVQSVAAGWLELTDAQTEELLSAHRSAMTWSLAVERKLVGLSRTFEDAGIAHAVLKGPSVAHVAYPEPFLRSFADLDLLVATRDYERTCTMLGGTGHVRQLPEPRAGFEVRFGKASVHIDPEDGIEVDLHRTLVLGPFGLWIDPDELLERRRQLRLGGRTVPRLDDTAMLLSVVLHAALGWRIPRLVPLRDVLQVSADGSIDWDLLARWTRAWRLAAVMRYAFGAAADVLGAELPEAARPMLRISPTRAEERALAAYRGAARGHGGTARATIRAIPGLGAKAAYVAALTVPRREFLEARTASGRRPSYLRRFAVPVRWVRSRP
jgi:hypothetical protein